MSAPRSPSRAKPLPAAPTETGDWLALDHQLCFALYAASLAMTKAYKPLLAPLGLTYPQYLVMLVLWEAGAAPASASASASASSSASASASASATAPGLTVSQLGERLTLDSGTLTPLLKRLAALGLLQRQRDASDERRVLLRLTTTGLALKAQALAVPQAIACATACDLQQIGQLATQLTTLRRQLQAAAPGAKSAGSTTLSPRAAG